MYTIIETIKEAAKINNMIILETEDKNKAERKYKEIISAIRSTKPDKATTMIDSQITKNKHQITYRRNKKPNLVYQIELINNA